MIWRSGCRAVVVAAVALLPLLAVVPVAEACMCMARPCGAVSTTAQLFEATVERIETLSGGERLAHLTDVRSVRGAATPAFVVSGNGVDCGYQFRAGVRYLIEAEPDSGR